MRLAVAKEGESRWWRATPADSDANRAAASTRGFESVGQRHTAPLTTPGLKSRHRAVFMHDAHIQQRCTLKVCASLRALPRPDSRCIGVGARAIATRTPPPTHSPTRAQSNTATMEGPPKVDDMSGYVSIYEALGKLSKFGTVLGSVLNGATVKKHEHEDDDAYWYKQGVKEKGEDYGTDEETDEEDASAPKSWGLAAWGRTMGALYEKLTTYTAFAVGGQESASFYNSDGVTTTAQLEVMEDGKVVKAWALNKPLPVDELLPYCTTAGFGDLKTQTTVVDASVRAAVELPSDAYAALHDAPIAPRVTFRVVNVKAAKDGTDRCKRVPGRPKFVTTVQEAVHNKLVSANFAMIPYKLNVYGAGGFFKPHVDTPTVDSAHMVGTVVVALPSAFEGGALSVRAPSGTAPTNFAAGGGGAAAAAAASGGGCSSAVAAAASGGGSSSAGAAIATAAAAGEEEETAMCTFNWAPASAGTTGLQWAAFFGDCVHEVEPVTAGHRVTITYAIVVAGVKTADDTKAIPKRYWFDKPVVPSVAVSAPLVSAPHIARLVAHAAACPAPTFGILLTHKYTFTGIESATLKGMDRVVYDALVHAGLHVALRPVMYSMHLIGPYPGYSVHESGRVTNVIYAFGADEVARLRAGTKGGTGATDIPFVRCSAAKYGRLRDDEPVGVRLQHIHTAEAEHTGNEARAEEDHMLYFAAALMVSM